MNRLCILLSVLCFFIITSCEKANVDNTEYQAPELMFFINENVLGGPSIDNAGVSILIGIAEEDTDFWRLPLSLSIETSGKNNVYLIGGTDDSGEYIIVDEKKEFLIGPWGPESGLIAPSEYSNFTQFAILYDQFMLNSTFRHFVFRVKLTVLT